MHRVTQQTQIKLVLGWNKDDKCEFWFLSPSGRLQHTAESQIYPSWENKTWELFQFSTEGEHTKLCYSIVIQGHQ